MIETVVFFIDAAPAAVPSVALPFVAGGVVAPPAAALSPSSA